MRAKISIAMAALCGGVSWAQAADELRSTLDDQVEVAVTVYNQDLALVKDVRKVVLAKGTNKLAFREVSARIRPETALLRGLTQPSDLTLIEQNFDFDLLTPEKLLEKFVGQTVSLVKVHPTTGEETTEEATVLSAQQGVVLKVGNRIETGAAGRLVYHSVPANLRDRPTLVVELDSAAGVAQQVELSYLTSGLSWRADYVAELSPRDDQLDLNGWVTLTNASGSPYNNARLQLVAGDVNRVRDELAETRVRKMVAMEAAAAAPAFAEEGLFEYHLYTLDRKTTLADNQTKQIALLSASAVPVRKELLLAGADYYYMASYGDIGQKMKVSSFVEFQNKPQSRLGMPLPAGVVRVYKRDASGRAQFIGEDRVDHTPKNELVRLKLGEAFDVTADKKQTDFKKLAGSSQYNYVSESEFEIKLKNAKSEAVTVTVREPIPGDWKMLQESHPHQKVAAGTAQWQIAVPAAGESLLKYRVQVRQ